MSGAGEATLTRVVSPDGTEIAYWTSGEGPPLVLVHGAPTDHTRWRPLLPYLEPHATVHAIDRRGRGASGDGTGYDIVLLTGEVSPDPAKAAINSVAAALPDARIVVIEGLHE